MSKAGTETAPNATWLGLPSLVDHADACGIALFAMANPLPKDGSAPEWVTVFPKAGRVETRDGRAFDVSAATLMAAFREDAINIPVDVNHATDAAGMFGGPAPAVGWGTELREHEGGLQLKVDWLDEGRALLKARQYLYTSPSFFQDKNRATRLKALALVTSPALARQPALARAGGPSLASLRAIATALGLDAGAGEAECLQAVSSLRTDAVPRAQHEAVVARLSALETNVQVDTVERLLDDAVKAMKIMPAEREGYAALCATPAGLRQVEQLFASKMPKLRPSGLDGLLAPTASLDVETGPTLADRATRYREQQLRAGHTISPREAVVYAAANPRAGL